LTQNEYVKVTQTLCKNDCKNILHLDIIWKQFIQTYFYSKINHCNML